MIVLLVGWDIVAGFDGCEEGLELIVVLLEDGVEFVIVASSAGESHTEEDFAGDIGQIIEDVVPLGTDVALVVFIDPVA